MSKGRRRRVATAGVVMATVVVALGGAAGAEAAPGPVAAPPRAPAELDPLAFFSDVAAAIGTDPEMVAKMRGSTVADSVAYHWLTYMMGYGLAFGDLAQYPQLSVTLAGTEPTTSLLMCADDSPRVNALPPPTTTTPGTVAPGCAVLADFTYAADGRLESFTANGQPLAGRFGLVDAALPGAARVVGTGFLRISDGGLLLPLEITAGSDSVTIDWASAAYLDPSGSRIALAVDGSGWRTETAAGATGYAVAMFPGATPGGVIEVAVGSTTTVATALVRIPVLAA